MRAAEQEAGSKRAASLKALRESRAERLGRARRSELDGKLDLGVPEQQIGRAFLTESEGGAHLRMRRGTIFHDKRVKLPDDLRAAGLEIIRLSGQAEQLTRLRGSLGDIERSDKERLIADPWRTRIIAADRTLTRIKSTLRPIPTQTPPLTQWDLINLFALQGLTFAAIAPKGPNVEKRRRGRVPLSGVTAAVA